VKPRLVFLRPRNADNLVAIAETMARFGLSEWVVVSPVVHLETMRDVLRSHRAPNPFSAQVERVRRVDSLAEAVEGCTWVVGTTMRAFESLPHFEPRELAAHAPDAPWALVFGAEANGMTNDDLAQCHAISSLPSSEEQPSLNLAQAMLLYAYELSASSHPEFRAAMSQRFGDEAAGLSAPLLRGGLSEREAASWARAVRAAEKPL